MLSQTFDVAILADHRVKKKKRSLEMSLEIRERIVTVRVYSGAGGSALIFRNVLNI